MACEYNIKQDISLLTNVNEYTILKFKSIIENCISHYIHETKLNKETISDVDIGIGTLVIKQTEEDISYKFIPSKSLERSIIKSLKTNSSPLISMIEEKLQEKISSVYKELL